MAYSVTRTEQLSQARKHGTDQEGTTNITESPHAVLPIRIPGVRYDLVSLTGKGLEKYLVSQLSWLSYL